MGKWYKLLIMNYCQFFVLSFSIILIFYTQGLSAQSQTNSRKSDSLEIVRLSERFEILLKGNQINSAREIVDSIKSLAIRSNLDKSVGVSYFNYGLIERALKNTPGFLENLRLSIPWFLKGGAPLSAARAHTIIGQTVMSNDYSVALENFMASLELRQQENDSLGITNNLVNIGGMHYQKGNYTESNNYYYQALQMADKIGNNNLKAFSLTNLSNIHNKLKNYDVSHDYLRQALSIHQESGNKKSEFKVMMGIGNTFYEAGNKTEAKKHFEQALDFLLKSDADESGLIQVYNNLGLVAKSEGDTVQAIGYFTKTLELSRKLGNKHGITIALSNLGPLTEKKNEASSLNFIMESLNEARLLGHRKLILSNYGNLRDYYSNKGDYKNAYYYANEYQMLNDSIYNEENANTIIELQTRYETAEKEKQLVLVKKEKLEKELELNRANLMKYGMLGFSVLLVLLLGSLYSRYLIKRRSQIQLAQVNEKLNELNSTKDKLFSIISHDLKNSMSGYTGIVNTINKSYEKFTAEEIRYYIGELTGSANSMKNLLRNLLDWARSQQNLIQINQSEMLIREIFNECAELLDQQIRNKNIRVTSMIDDGLTSTNDKNIVTTILRNLMVNAVKYSFEGGCIEISASKADDGSVGISVRDYGVGMEQDELALVMNGGTYVKSRPGVNGEKGAGLGLMLTKELLSKINGRLEIDSKKDAGSTFRIILPDFKGDHSVTQTDSAKAK
ncbi:MAG: tetratricopeptide repeat-containing sensor histidine kinase [Lentimicrobium sp.]|nr:tetratricopeptide repeat-containing sensor histidine kinase [Lentimicrobium sp.]